MDRTLVCIIGIDGRFGRWLKYHFESRGDCIVFGSDIHLPYTNEEVVREADVVIFAVPIRNAAKVIESLVKLSRPEQLWMDVTGIKSPAVHAMLKSKAEVVGLHPMCAPTVEILRGQTMVVHKARLDRWAAWVDEFLSRTQATIKIATPEEHDKNVSVVQCLSHAIILTMAAVIRVLGIDIRESMTYTSPFYRIVMCLMGRILKQDVNLYMDMQMHNPYTLEVLDTFLQEFTKFRNIVAARNEFEFVETFYDSRTHLGIEETNKASGFFDDLIHLQADLMSDHVIEVQSSEDDPGILHKITGLFAERKVNLTSVHSQHKGALVCLLFGFTCDPSSPEINEIIGEINEWVGFKAQLKKQEK